jgi:DNA ligase (NAD+)
MFEDDFKDEEVSIPEIVSKLKEASDAYYNGQDSIMSDEEFDNLKDLLKKVDPKNKFLFQIGAAVEEVSSWKKEKHKIPMGSLNKVNTVEEFNKWCKDVGADYFVVMTKMDGISIDLEYSKGKLIKAITRGDGILGEDILSNVVQMINVKKKLKDFTGSLRGEIVIHKDDFVKLNIESEKNGDRVYKNPRNAASGISKAYDGKYAKFCSVLYYDVKSNTDYEFEYRKFGHIIDLGLEPCWYSELNIVGSIGTYERFEEKLREEYPYEIDGLVVAVNDVDKQTELGFVYDNPKGKIAWKFGAIKKETFVKDIEWQMGLNRRITPVLKVEPIQCGGVEIKNVTLHNYDLFEKAKLAIGDKILISRANDVIPFFEKVLERNHNVSLEAPSECPSCGADTEVDGKFLICPNDGCESLYLGCLQKWVDKLEIMGISYSIIEKLYRANKIRIPSDFYYLNVEDFIGLDGLGEKSGKKIIDQLQAKKEIDLATFIGGLNMASFSSSLCERLMNAGHDSIDALMCLTEDKLCTIPGIKEKIAKKIVKGLESKLMVVNGLLKAGVKVKRIEKTAINMQSEKLKGMSFVFTGAIQKMNAETGERYTREQLMKMVVENGGENHSTVKKGTTFLVQADPSSQSTKTKKAIQVGTKILGEADFFKLIGKE